MTITTILDLKEEKFLMLKKELLDTQDMQWLEFLIEQELYLPPHLKKKELLSLSKNKVRSLKEDLVDS